MLASERLLAMPPKAMSLAKSLHYSKPGFLVCKMRQIPWLIIRKIKKAPSSVLFPQPSRPPHPCSVAILLYLTRKYKVPDHWYPQDLQARARVDEYLAWQHTTLRRNCLRALWHKVRPPEGGRVGRTARASPPKELKHYYILLFSLDSF